MFQHSGVAPEQDQLEMMFASFSIQGWLCYLSKGLKLVNLPRSEVCESILFHVNLYFLTYTAKPLLRQLLKQVSLMCI